MTQQEQPLLVTANETSRLSLLRTEVELLYRDAVAFAEDNLQSNSSLHELHRRSALNLLHYVALRRHDVRALQRKLAALGLSSLGRAEAAVAESLHAVLRILRRLLGEEAQAAEGHEPALTLAEGKALLERNTETLLGPRPPGRFVRIMVTMPSGAQHDYGLVRDLLARGMDCMRINCAHDDTQAWSRMVEHLRQAERELNRPCRVLMDLAGPKLRTGELVPGPQVVKWRPERDLSGRVVCPAKIWLTAAEEPQPAPAAADASLPVAGAWLNLLRPGTRVKLTDTRGRFREMLVIECLGAGVWAQSPHTAYVRTGTVLHAPRWQKKPRKTVVGELPARLMPLALKKGDLLRLTNGSRPGCAALELAGQHTPAQIPCTLPEVFADVQPGEPVWFDDGRIGGVLREVHADHVLVEIVHAADSGATLGPDKGINLPESTLRLPSLMPQDRNNLEFIVQHADLVGYSFVRTAEDVHALQAELARLKGEHLGIILKIETREAFEHLPNLLLAGMRHPATGVMIARGDLAVECGYERLAEIQEEILWVSEAAHVPVIWATQVLESLAKHGLHSRAEITDAAMGERAECVMLNKGPHIVEAVAALDDILKRMQAHQNKKRPVFRPLRLAGRFGTNSRGA